MVTSVVLIRHAASEVLNGEPRIPGPSLTSEGKRQAKKTASFFEGVSFSAVYSSNMSRALETVKLITSEEVVVAEELSEFNKIVFEEEPEFVDKFNDNIELALSAKAFFEKILRKHRDSKLLVVTHGNVIRYLVSFFLKLKPHSAPNFLVSNASITHLFFDGNELVSVGCVNSTAHLLIKD